MDIYIIVITGVFIFLHIPCITVCVFFALCSGGGTELSYEERAAQRRAERDRRRREREALAK